MPLFQIQDHDRPMWAIALDYGDAVWKWKTIVGAENNEDPEEVDNPQGVMFVCDDEELIR